MTSQFLTYRDVVARLRRSRSAIEADIKAGLFPAPALFGRNAVWPSVEVSAFASAVAAGADPESLKQLVKELIQARPARAAAARAAAIGSSAKTPPGEPTPKKPGAQP
jgi:predicted DNA-binding transcriptional regulator AlpA